ncbi:unnamed protein product [Ectocarpus sp. 4 AP-2014]
MSPFFNLHKLICAVNHSGSQHTPLFLTISPSCRHNRVRWVFCSHPILYPPRLFYLLPKGTSPLQHVVMVFSHHLFTSHVLPQRPTSQEYQGTTTRVQPRFDTDSH